MMPLSLINTANATVKLNFVDVAGRSIAPPSGGAVASSNSIVTATLESDGATVLLVTTPQAFDVSGTLTYSNSTDSSLIATETWTLSNPKAVSVAFDETSLTFVPR